jgi:hypothetical protein
MYKTVLNKALKQQMFVLGVMKSSSKLNIIYQIKIVATTYFFSTNPLRNYVLLVSYFYCDTLIVNPLQWSNCKHFLYDTGSTNSGLKLI